MISAQQLGWWALDYLYAGRQQLVSLFRPSLPARYSAGDPRLPLVVLLPGVYEGWLFLEPAASRLNALGYRVVSVPGLGLNRRSVPDSAALVTKFLAQLGDTHGDAHGDAGCILVAHSKGGLIGKRVMLDAELSLDAIVKHDAGSPVPAPSSPAEVLGLVTVATPFSGSPYARYQLSRTLRDFSPVDAVLLALQAETALNHKVFSIYPEFDPHIPSGSYLAGAVNIELPVAGHFRTLQDETVLEAVLHAVAEISGER